MRIKNKIKEMAQSINYKHADLNLGPQHPNKKPGTLAGACNTSSGKVGKPWGGLAKLMSLN